MTIALLTEPTHLDSKGLPGPPKALVGPCEVLYLDEGDIEVRREPDSVHVTVRGADAVAATFTLRPIAVDQITTMFERINGGAMDGIEPAFLREDPRTDPPAGSAIGNCASIKVFQLDQGMCFYMRGTDTRLAFRIVVRTKERLAALVSSLRAAAVGAEDHFIQLDVPYSTGEVFAPGDTRAKMGRALKTASSGYTGKMLQGQDGSPLVALGLLPEPVAARPSFLTRFYNEHPQTVTLSIVTVVAILVGFALAYGVR